jgi:hypothetical protein
MIKIGFLLLLTSAAGCGAANGICNTGCLCFRTPKDCPAGCFPTYTPQTDASSTFYCSNTPPPDAGTD